jgi:hypothetical protein
MGDYNNSHDMSEEHVTMISGNQCLYNGHENESVLENLTATPLDKPFMKVE